MTLKYHVAPGAYVSETYTNKRDALAAAKRSGAHVHQEERETGRGWIYRVCNCPAC